MKKTILLSFFAFVVCAFIFTITSCTPNNTPAPIRDTITIRDTINTRDTICSTNCFGAVACYSFNGNANDASGNNHNGTVVGATLATGRKGAANSCYYFRGYRSGNPDYITLPTLQSINNTEEISISMWLKADSINLGGTPFTMMPDASGDRLNAHINYLPFQLVWDNGDIFGTGRVFQYRSNSFNKWDHYVFIKSATNNKMQVYLNNVLVIDANKHDNISNKNKNIRLGGGAGNTEYFGGWMDDVKIFNRALTATDVTSLYNE